jgi:hypothetical protein
MFALMTTRLVRLATSGGCLVHSSVAVNTYGIIQTELKAGTKVSVACEPNFVGEVSLSKLFAKSCRTAIRKASCQRPAGDL